MQDHGREHDQGGGADPFREPADERQKGDSRHQAGGIHHLIQTHGAQDRDLADLWVDRLQNMAEKNPSHLVVVVADMAKSDLPLSSSFVAEFCQRLSRQNPVLHLARSWLEQRLAEQGLSIEQLVHLDSQSQAADQVSVSHSIVERHEGTISVSNAPEGGARFEIRI